LITIERIIVQVSPRVALSHTERPDKPVEKVPRSKGRAPQLDVLRGIAILLVLCFHPAVQYRTESEAPWLALGMHRIGWTGVNLFFVLSGFLVGGMLLAEVESCGRLRVRQFLIRRALKIWPSYYALLTVRAIQAAQLGSDPWDFWPFLVHVQNYKTSSLGLLPHSWSLAVEEHFYLLLPLTLAVIPYRGRRACLAGTWAVLAVGCAVARAWDRATFPTFPTHHNLDALAWGVVLACIVSAPRAPIRKAQPGLLLASGFGLLTLSFYYDGAGTSWSSALVPVGLYLGYGQVLLGFVNLPVDRFRGWIAWGIATVGFYSYAIYLWHLSLPVPLSRLIDAAVESHGASPWTRLVVVTPLYVGLAIGVGVLTSRTIEQPFLALRDRLWPRGTVAH
jgi:peptidoglycan/LPS O-acetylase OafA/YrhL